MARNAAAGATTVYSVQYVVGGPGLALDALRYQSRLDSGSVSLRFISNEGTQIGNMRVLPIAAWGRSASRIRGFSSTPAIL